MTDGTACQVECGDAQEEIDDGLGGGGRDRRYREAEEFAAALQALMAAAVGEQAVVADADEAGREDMQEEPAQELVDGKGDGLQAAAVSVVLDPEADDVVGEPGEAVVGEGDAVGVAGEVVEERIGAGLGRLAEHDPGSATQGAVDGGERCGETGVERGGAVEGVEEAGAEDARQGAYGEEEAVAGGDPAGVVGGEGATGDDAVQVDVQAEVAAPGVQNGDDAGGAAEMTGVGGEGAQGRGGGLEQEVVGQAAVVQGDRVEVVRQSEDDVEVGDGKGLGTACGEPALGVGGLALGAVAVAAGVVGDADGAAAVAGVGAAAEGGGAAEGNGAQGSALGAGQGMGAPVGRAAGPDDVGELQARR